MVTRSPTWAGSWADRMRCMVVNLLERSQRDPQGGVGEREPRGATTPSPRPDGRGLVRRPMTGAGRRALLSGRAPAVLPAAQEGLHAPAPGHLHSCRWLSLLAVRGATRLRRRCWLVTLPARP